MEINEFEGQLGTCVDHKSSITKGVHKNKEMLTIFSQTKLEMAENSYQSQIDILLLAKKIVYKCGTFILSTPQFARNKFH